MVDLIGRVSPAANVAEAFLQTTHEQLRAAQSHEWTRVAELADFRDVLLQRLGEVTAGTVAENDRVTLVTTLSRVQELDDEIQRRTKHEARRVQDELSEIDRGRAVASGYGWSNSASSSRMFDRYG